MSFRSIIICFLLLQVVGAFSQSKYRFYTLGTDQGLSSDYTWTVCKDKYNQVWIGTQNGLNRYDGHTVKKYSYNSNDSFSIPGNSIYWIHKDDEGERV